MTTITCKVPAKLGADLAAAAREEGVPKSEIIRQAIEQRVKHRRRKKAPRAYDLVKHLAGAVKGGPKDLAGNPRHLENLGA